MYVLLSDIGDITLLPRVNHIEEMVFPVLSQGLAGQTRTPLYCVII